MISFVVFLVPSFIFFTGASPALAEPQELELDFNRKTLSVDIQNARLRSVIEATQKQEGIWVKYLAQRQIRDIGKEDFASI
jgi:hypothetical protein